MSVLDSLDSLLTHVGITVTRHAIGTYTNGVYTPAAPTTLTIDAVVQPAFNLNRVVGGADLHAHVDNQSATDVRQLHTRTELRTRTPTNDPDVLTLDGADWTVIRVEPWDLDGERHYHCVLSKITHGGA